MGTDMGSFRVDLELENPARPGARRTVPLRIGGYRRGIVVGPGGGARIPGRRAQPAVALPADGTILERRTGSVLVHVAGKRAADEVVFGEPGDLILMGSRTLAGLNFRVEPVTKQLVDAGPAPAAVAA